MRIALFCHSLLSDWNHGNAHFLRGLLIELQSRGIAVEAFEAEDAWSLQNLLQESGSIPSEELARYYPGLRVVRYARNDFDVAAATSSADLVLVHEWSPPELVAALGRERTRGAAFKLLFHDTHHRSVTDPEAMMALDLSGYDGVLAFGEAVRERYLKLGWANRVWTFHEAADTRVFRPLPDVAPSRDLVWIGNWGDEERTRELSEFLLEPARTLAVSGSVYGVRYPASAVQAIEDAGLSYHGWLANYRAPEVFARHRLTVHVPRRPYAASLPGVPTIRVFEALACGVPLISAPWSDCEGLFREGDFLRVRDGEEMKLGMRLLLNDPAARHELSVRGRETIEQRHTCGHRADELLRIAESIGVETRRAPSRLSRTAETAAWE